MTSDKQIEASVAASIAALRSEVAALGERLAAVERAVAATSAADSRLPAPPQERTPEELVAVISAALAAYLGVKPHIRQISLIGGRSWAQQGRVTIQASHALAVARD